MWSWASPGETEEGVYGKYLEKVHFMRYVFKYSEEPVQGNGLYQIRSQNDQRSVSDHDSIGTEENHREGSSKRIYWKFLLFDNVISGKRIWWGLHEIMWKQLFPRKNVKEKIHFASSGIVPEGDKDLLTSDILQ